MILDLSFFKIHRTSLFCFLIRPERNVASENHSVRRHNLPETYIVLLDTCAFVSITLSESTHDDCFNERRGTGAHYIYAIRALSANACISESSPETCSRSSWSLAVFSFSPVNCCLACGIKFSPPVDRRKRSLPNLFPYSPLFFPLPVNAGVNGVNPIDRRGKVRRTRI